MSELTVTREQEDLIVRLRGEIDHHGARTLREQIDDAVSRSRPHRLVLDMGGISFMDSSGIGLILGRYRLMQTLGGTLRLVNLSEPMRRLLQLAGLYKLALYDTEDAHETQDKNRKDDTR